METFAYLQLFLVYDAPPAPLEPLVPRVRKFFAEFKGKNFSSAGWIRLFSVAVTVALLSMATQVLAYQRGDESEAVRGIQVRLQQLGYFSRDVEPTSFYGEITEEAVRRFQRDHSLPVTGRVDPETLTAIERLLLPAPSFGQVTQVGTTNQVLRLGDKGLSVSALQDQLRQLGYLNRAATGQFDFETQQAVLRFQQAFNIQQTGEVGPTTRGFLDEQLARIPAAQTWQPVTQIPNETVYLKLGDRGIAVKYLQERLIAAGYAIGTADGIFGPRTEEALKQFQLSVGLVPTGVANADTRQALDRKFYVVVVPKRSNFSLSAVREIFPDAFEAENRLGTYIHAGSYPRREVPETRAKILKQRGLIDTRVAYF